KIPFLAVLGLFLLKIVRGGSDHGRVRTEVIGGSFSNTLALDTNLVLEYLRSAFVPTQTRLRIPRNDPESCLYVTGVPDIFVYGFSPIASLVILACLATCAVVLARFHRWPYLLRALVASVVSV